MNTLLAWHNDPALKAEVLSRMLQHRVEDSIIQGVYQMYDPRLASKYKGCLIGCTLPMAKTNRTDPNRVYIPDQDDWHQQVEKLYGIPVALNHLFDSLFEGLPMEKAAWFAVGVIEAIPVGADLSVVITRFVDELNLPVDQVQDLKENNEEEWLKAVKNFHLDILEHTNEADLDWVAEEALEFQRVVELAERLLKHLSEAPVPAPRIPAPHPETLNFVPTPEEIKV